MPRSTGIEIRTRKRSSVVRGRNNVPSRMQTFRHTATAGMGRGDCGKGEASNMLLGMFLELGLDPYNLRISGTDNAGHGNTYGTGFHHIHNQVPSGMGRVERRVSGYLRPDMAISPRALMSEIATLEAYERAIPFSGRLHISPRCPIVTPADVLFGRMLEHYRGPERAGSTGKGAGELARKVLGCTLDENFEWHHTGDTKYLTLGDLSSAGAVRSKLSAIFDEQRPLADRLHQAVGNRELGLDYDFDTAFSLTAAVETLTEWGSALRTYLARSGGDKSYLQEILAKGHPVNIEGTQGHAIMGSLGSAPWPHGTKGPFRLQALVSEFKAPVHTFGMMRLYPTRHGRGPFVTEESGSEFAPMRDDTGYDAYAESFRAGWPDLLILRRSADELLPHSLFITCVDRMSHFDTIKVCVGYRFKGNEAELEQFARRAGEQLYLRTDLETDKERYTKMTDARERQKYAKLLRKRGVYEKDTDSTVLLTQYIPVKEIEERCDPIYIEFPGWSVYGADRVRDAEHFEALPPELRELLSWLEIQVGIPISVVSTGPSASDKIWIRN